MSLRRFQEVLGWASIPSSLIVMKEIRVKEGRILLVIILYSISAGTF